MNRKKASSKRLEFDNGIPLARNIPLQANLNQQTVLECHGILVSTGVYRPSEYVNGGVDGKENPYHGHRDFRYSSKLSNAKYIASNVHEAVKWILKEEHVSFVNDDVFEG